MNMVVERNVHPALPPVAVFLGAGIATLGLRLGERAPAYRRWLVAAVAAVCLLPPLAKEPADQEITISRSAVIPLRPPPPELGEPGQ